MRPAVKYAVIYSNKDKYTISTMCKFFAVSRSGYYDYLKRKNAPHRDEALAALISECHSSSYKTYGYRRMQMWLEQEKGVHRNPKTVLRVMQKYGMLSEIRRRRRYRKMGMSLYRYPNLLDRQFTAQRPNQKWVTDISYISTGQGVLYLSIIRDLYDNSVVAYKTASTQTTRLVTDTIRLARKKEKVTEELQLHSDQGTQYTSAAYRRLTKAYGIIPSMSRRGNCLDNAMAENFFSILKTECVYRHKIDSFRKANQLIQEYIWFYNHERIQLSTGRSPMALRQNFAA